MLHSGSHLSVMSFRFIAGTAPVGRWLLIASCLVGGFAGDARADYAYYNLPGTNLVVPLNGSVRYLAGGMATVKHPRGSLHFRATDLQVVKSPTAKQLYVKRALAAKRSGSVDEMIDAARWALHHGLLSRCKKMLGHAWRTDPSDERLKRLAGVIRFCNAAVPDDSTVVATVESEIGGGMDTTRSRHFILFHDENGAVDEVSGRSRAELRLDLLEKVYESFFLTFAFEGVALRPPTKPLPVVLFDRHADFLMMERRQGRSLAQVAGFYDPESHVAYFYDHGSGETFQALMKLRDGLTEARQGIARMARGGGVAGSGDVIRTLKTIELLIDIERESEDVRTVSHEVTHQLSAAVGMFPRDGAFVRWVHEGLASFFESAKQARWSGVGVVDRQRIDYYRALEGDAVRGSIEFIVSDLGFAVESMLGSQLPAYGQAWALTHFLFNERFDQLVRFYQRIGKLEPLDDEPTGEEWIEQGEEVLKIFDDCFGDRTALELQWRRYMRTLRTDREQLIEAR